MSAVKNTILVVDDERPIQRLLELSLNSKDFKTILCSTGTEGMRTLATAKPDLMILDLGLSDMDGKAVLKDVREWSEVPIIICSVRNDDSEIIAALDLGANDYITKPFNPDVLISRVKANLRKAISSEHGEPEISNGPIAINLVRHEVTLHGKRLSLTPKEYELLRYFIIQKGKMLTHRQILKDVWGAAHVEDVQYLRVYLKQIREKIEAEDSETPLITTEPGIGYRMEVLS